jgi:hypothetical protein
MAAIRSCKHQGFAYVKGKNVHIICDFDGEMHEKEYCKKCKYYSPRTKQKGKKNDL